jgi:hypothetical protein
VLQAIKIFVTILGGVVILGSSAIAQEVSFREKQILLHQAICEHRWNSALRIIDQLRSASDISPEYRTELFLIRLKVQDFRSGMSQPVEIPACGGQEELVGMNPRVNWKTAQEDIERGLYTIGITYSYVLAVLVPVAVTAM